MKTTIKNRLKTKNKTKKNTTNTSTKPSTKIFQKNNSLYASKIYPGDELLTFTKNNETKKKQSCILENLSWFGDYKVAKSYQTSKTKLYEWKFKKPTKLLIMNEKNDNYFRSLFLQNINVPLIPAIRIPKDKIKKINYQHIYLSMTKNKRAYYEFCFVFGYLTIEEQYEFMKLLKYLLEEKIVIMDTRNGESILSKIIIKINYYKIIHLFNTKKKYNRLSFYQLDKHAVLNICKILKSKNINISGLFQENTHSFWFPDLIVHKMNIEETILFNPHDNLTFYKQIE